MIEVVECPLCDPNDGCVFVAPSPSFSAFPDGKRHFVPHHALNLWQPCPLCLYARRIPIELEAAYRLLSVNKILSLTELQCSRASFCKKIQKTCNR